MPRAQPHRFVSQRRLSWNESVVVGPLPRPNTASLPFTPQRRRSWSCRSGSVASSATPIDTGHLLLGIVREDESVATQVLRSLGVNPAALRGRIIKLMAGTREAEAGDVESQRTMRAMDFGAVTPTCTLCGRRIGEEGRYVVGAYGRMCAECIGASIQVLQDAVPERRKLFLPSRSLPPSVVEAPLVLWESARASLTCQRNHPVSGRVRDRDQGSRAGAR